MDNAAGQQLLEQGVVVALDEQFIWVATTRASGCGGCQSKTCGTSALAQLFTSSSKPIKVTRNIDCQLGDQVELALDESQLLKHTFMAYGIPLIGLFSGALLLMQLFAETSQPAMQDLMAVIGGLLGLWLGWQFTRRFYQPALPIINKVLSRPSANASDLSSG